ncbi:MAG: hypothetical protein HKP20_02950 [Akkermansiaceae bacterium]|nr:hypothetical protein [Akkermansiaceae bacterium]
MKQVRTIRIFLILAGLLMVVPLSAKPEAKHLFILSGQSNMRQPLPGSFSHCVEAVFGKDKVWVVTDAHPSQPIKMWYKEWQPPAGMVDENPEKNGTLYDRLMAKVKRTIKDTPLESVTFIWMQGEADAKAGWGSVYAAGFMGVLDQIREDLGVQDINFVVGRINDFWVGPAEFPDGQLIREIQVKLGEKHDNGAWINTDDLNRGVNPWGGYSLDDGHFPPPGYRVMGQRFARQACRLIDPHLKPDESIFAENFFDQASDVASHAAIGVKLSASVKPLHGSMGSLTDGKFGTAKMDDAAWVGFEPSDEPIELVLDLGKVMRVELTGINLLFSTDAKVELPKRIDISTSEDGENYALSGRRYNSVHLYHGTREALSELKATTPLLMITEQKHRKAPDGLNVRYVKFKIQSPDHRFYIDEIIVNPSLHK